MNATKAEQNISMGEMAKILGTSRSEAFSLRLKDSWPHTRVGLEFTFTPADRDAIKALYSHVEGENQK